MLRVSTSLLVMLVSQLALAEAPAAPARAAHHDRGLFWEVHAKNGGVAYLLGSIHMLDQSIYPLRDAIESAFKASSALAVEANIAGDQSAMTQKLMAAAAYPEGETLQQHVAKKTYDAAKASLPAQVWDALSLDHMKPWFVAMMIEAIDAQQLGLQPQLGLDMHFLNEAGSKKIVELEGMEFQIQMFDHLPADQQEGMLRSAAIGASDFATGIHDMLKAWRKGEADKMNELVHKDEQEDPTLKPVMDALLTHRNVGMVEKVAAMLDAGQTTFVVVGAAHLVGPLGVAQLLAKRGYTVEQK